MRQGTLVVMGLLVTVATLFAQNPDVRFEHAGPGGLRFVVTADGLSEIAVADRVVAAGGWYGWNAGPCWFGRGDKGLLDYTYYSAEVYRKAAAAVEEKSIELLGLGHVRVRHVQPDVTCTYDYVFDGEDVTIASRMENNHADKTVSVPAFGGLRFSFEKPPSGHMIVWHTSYLNRIWLEAFHPSHGNKFGGSFACDEAVGVGATPLKTGLARTLLFWDYDMWNPDTPERKANRWLTYLRPDPIPPGGALTFRMKLRVSTNNDWKHLLQPYKEHFLETFGPMQYSVDHRAVAVAHVNRNREAIGPGNPYGFHGGPRRLDLREGVEAFCESLLPGLAEANGQGVILWGQGGQEPRGQMYRADFDILPPEVEENWTLLRQRFEEKGLKLGATTRPRHMHIRLDWETDGTINVNADDPQHLEVQVWNRFKHMIDRGCTLFYLDSFGSQFGDVKIMRYLREKMGPDIQTFAEHACDVMAVYSAFYSETDFWAEGSADWAKEDGWRPRTGLTFLERVRWMVGEVPVISRGYDIHGTIPEGFESTTQFFYRNHMTPMLEDYRVKDLAPTVRALQEEWLSDDGKRWRK